MSNFKAGTLITRGNQTVGYWDKNTGYTVNEYVAYNGTMYYSLQSNNVNNTPDTSPTYWAVSAGGGNIGFIDYNDAATATTPITLIANTWTDVTNDGLGAFTNRTYAPTGINELMDTSTGYIDPTELSLGDVILIRNDYEVTPSINNALLEFRYSLGTGLGEYTLPAILGRLDDGAGLAYRVALTADKIYMGDTNTRDNPIKLQVKLSENGTLKNNGSVITVVR